MWVDSPCSRMASCRLLRPPFKPIFTAIFLLLPPKKEGLLAFAFTDGAAQPVGSQCCADCEVPALLFLQTVVILMSRQSLSIDGPL
jgi:hypothetical protein